MDDDYRNTIPIDLIRHINNIDNNILYSSSSYIRWDFSWYLFKTLRHQNCHDPSFSTFISFAIKCLNNTLSMGDILANWHHLIYDNWICNFCNQELETLQHLLWCFALCSTMENNLILITQFPSIFNPETSNQNEFTT